MKLRFEIELSNHQLESLAEEVVSNFDDPCIDDLESDIIEMLLNKTLISREFPLKLCAESKDDLYAYI